MSEHNMALVSAYYDGELHGRQLRHFEAHLASCPVCQRELETLRRMSQVLEDFTVPITRTSLERFRARVRARLPARQQQPTWKVILKGAWQATPALLFGTLTFGQAAIIVSGAVLTILWLRFGAAAPLLGSSWLLRLALLVGAALDQPAQAVLQFSGALSWFVLLNLALWGVIGLLYWGWLASWWAYRTCLPEARV